MKTIKRILALIAATFTVSASPAKAQSYEGLVTPDGVNTIASQIEAQSGNNAPAVAVGINIKVLPMKTCAFQATKSNGKITVDQLRPAASVAEMKASLPVMRPKILAEDEGETPAPAAAETTPTVVQAASREITFTSDEPLGAVNNSEPPLPATRPVELDPIIAQVETPIVQQPVIAESPEVVTQPNVEEVHVPAIGRKAPVSFATIETQAYASSSPFVTTTATMLVKLATRPQDEPFDASLIDKQVEKDRQDTLEAARRRGAGNTTPVEPQGSKVLLLLILSSAVAVITIGAWFMYARRKDKTPKQLAKVTEPCAPSIPLAEKGIAITAMVNQLLDDEDKAKIATKAPPLPVEKRKTSLPAFKTTLTEPVAAIIQPTAGPGPKKPAPTPFVLTKAPEAPTSSNPFLPVRRAPVEQVREQKYVPFERAKEHNAQVAETMEKTGQVTLPLEAFDLSPRRIRKADKPVEDSAAVTNTEPSLVGKIQKPTRKTMRVRARGRRDLIGNGKVIAA